MASTHVRDRLLKKVDTELAALERELKVDLPRQLAEPAAHGDLSENAEYDAAKARKEMVQNLMARLHHKKASLNSMSLGMIPHDAIGFWSTVELLDLETDGQVAYKLVTPDESDPKQGRVSITSPIGRALNGRRAGDEVEVVTPRGTRTYEILSFSTIHDDAAPE